MTDNSDYNLILFHFAYQTFIKTADEIIAKYGMSRQHHRFLFYISKMPGISVKELLDFLEITKQGSHRTLSKLKEEILIEENPSNTDRRIKKLYPTSKGLELVKILNMEQNNLLSGIFAESGNDWFQIMEQLAQKREGFRTIQAKYQLGEETSEEQEED